MKRTNSIVTLNRNDVDAIFNAKVAELVAQGYAIRPVSTSSNWPTGRPAKVHLHKGDDHLMVWRVARPDCMTGIPTIHIRICRCNGGRCDMLDVLEDTKLTIVAPRNGIYASIEDGMAIEQLRVERRKARGDRCCGVQSREVTNPAAKAIALRFLKRQPRMKSCRLGDIDSVERIERVERGQQHPIFEGYRIDAKGKAYFLTPAKA